ncbi:MAG: molybdopterin molybdotransferase MoeA [Chloroflexi bacterium]|nr:molybdopterin molybdotransferase MoeA [Chloroflexota bacterium]
MLSVEEAREKVLALVPVLDARDTPLLEALGLTLAEDANAAFDIPPWDNSGQDGYAVRADDIAGASAQRPAVLHVTGYLAAGQTPSQAVAPGEALRIMTGAPIPPGADTVVPFEETDELARKADGRAVDHIAILKALPKGGNVRLRGEDVRRGEAVLPRGVVLRPGELGVLASLGFASVKAVRRPVVAVLSTGDELQQPGQPLAPGRIYDSNSYSIAGLIEKYGGIPLPLGIARDNLDSLNGMLARGLEADMLITSAGVSKGDYDMVKDVLAEHGEIAFWSVRMRPAKPLAFGVLRGPGGRRVPHLGLPGNPVSAMVAFEELGRPALLKMMGRTKLDKPTVEAVLEDTIINHDGRRVYARAWVTRRGDTYYARTTGPQGSNILTSMARANGLAICPEDTPRMGPGERVKVRMLDWDEEGVY